MSPHELLSGWMSTADAGPSAQQTPTPAGQEEDPWTWTWTRDNLAVVSILIKEKKQLKDAVRRYEAAEERMEKYKNGPLARQRLDRLLREVNRDGMQPSHVHELREILEEFPEDEAAPLRQKLIEYEWRRLLDLGSVPASKF